MESSDSVTVNKSAADDEVLLDRPDATSGVSNESRGVKRPAEDDLRDSIGDENENEDDGDGDGETQTHEPDEEVRMSQSQLKKLRKKERWEGMRDERRIKRRDKRHKRQDRKRAQKEEEIAAAAAEGREPVLASDRRWTTPRVKVPVAIIIDCQYEKYMQEGELISLSSQVTRAYADNKGARHPVHLSISSYGGYIKQRNETLLENQHLKWKGVRFCEGDFVQAASEAREDMAGPRGGEIIDLLKQGSSGEPGSSAEKKKAQSAPIPEPEAEDVDKSIVYLTADSPYVLDRLEPNTSYVIGGIIDKNREKGLCYSIAREKNVRTAKLPISEYMTMQHRHILATNHVVEIMLKYLETGDWGAAFLKVIPTRKGGKLKTDGDTPTDNANGDAVEGPESSRADDDAQQVLPTTSDIEVITTTENADEPVEVEGDNAEDGLEKNALDEPRWSAPPLEVEVEEGTAEKQTSTNLPG
ncbi:tRNA-methyltransferase-domain-containing protein [Nemania sp. FL0916]|nr:tRNA-methyltransferase-domain-containing protein [Nemania sp. FL0916]